MSVHEGLIRVENWATKVALYMRTFQITSSNPAARARELRLLAAAMATLAMAVMLRIFVIEIQVIPSFSMAPALKPGDRIFVAKLFKKASLRRGEVVVMRRGDGERWCKRITGLPGETIEGMTVPLGQVYLAGDNRDVSEKVGCVSLSAICGRVVMAWYGRQPIQYAKFDKATGMEAKLYQADSVAGAEQRLREGLEKAPAVEQVVRTITVHGTAVSVIRVDPGNDRSLTYLSVEGDQRSTYSPGRWVWYDNAYNPQTKALTTSRACVRVDHTGLETDQTDGKTYTTIFPSPETPIQSAGGPGPGPLYLLERSTPQSVLDWLRTPAGSFSTIVAVGSSP